MTPHVNDHDTVQQLLGGYALDGLDPVQARTVERHVARCASCHAELQSLLVASEALGVAVPQSPMPRGIRAGVLASIDALEAAPRLDPARSAVGWRTRLAHRFALGSPAFAAVAAACVLVVGVGIGTRIDGGDGGASRPTDATSSTPRPGADTFTGTSDVVQVDTSGALAGAAMELVDVHGAGMLVTKDLPEPPAGYAWRVWGVKGAHDMHAIGPLAPREEGVMGIQPVVGVHGGGFDAVAITLERADARSDVQEGPVVGWARMA